MLFPNYIVQSDRVGVSLGIYATRDLYPKPGRYPLTSIYSTGFLELNNRQACPTVSRFFDPNDFTPIYREDYLGISKLDTINRIIAGTFEYTIVRAGCDTVRVTNGRFDLTY